MSKDRSSGTVFGHGGLSLVETPNVDSRLESVSKATTTEYLTDRVCGDTIMDLRVREVRTKSRIDLYDRIRSEEYQPKDDGVSWEIRTIPDGRNDPSYTGDYRCRGRYTG